MIYSIISVNVISKQSLELFEIHSRKFENELHRQQAMVENSFSRLSINDVLLGQHHREAPLFKIFAELAIPNVTIRPNVDEVQMYLNRSVQTIISVSKCISQWDKDRSKVDQEQAPPQQDLLPVEYERRPTILFSTEHDASGINPESASKDGVVQVIPTSENFHPRPRVIESNDSQRTKMPVPVANNFYKNVSENKDIIKLVSQLATCINTTKKVIRSF